MFINHDPFLVIISSPSGAGKSTICKMIIQNDPLIKLSISATTRIKRPQENEGADYFFLQQEKFLEMKNNDQFLESAKVFENYYGTPKLAVTDFLNKGYEVLFDIDWQGARQIKQSFNANSVVSIFILTPSLQELKRRLMARGQDSEQIVAKRMEKSLDEISHFQEYDFVIINDDLANSYQKIKSIIEAKRIERYNKNNLIKFVDSLNK